MLTPQEQIALNQYRQLKAEQQIALLQRLTRLVPHD